MLYEGLSRVDIESPENEIAGWKVDHSSRRFPCVTLLGSVLI